MKAVMTLFFALICSSWLWGQSQGGSGELPFVAYVKGNAYIYDENAQEREANKGETIKLGEVIRTAADSFLILQIRDRVKVKIDPKTVIEIESLLDANRVKSDENEDSIFVHAGNIFVHFVKDLASGQHMQVKTKYTSLGVRGTKFFVYMDRQDERKYTMAVESGEVEVSSTSTDSKILVGAGNGSLLDPNGNLSTAKKYDWVSGLNWNLDPSKGSLGTSEKVFAKMRQDWENYSKQVIKKRDSYFKSQQDKFKSLKSR